MYLLAIISMVISGIFCVTSKKVNWAEWLLCSAAAFLVTGLVHAITYFSATDDSCTMSGVITSAIYYPEYVEEYHDTHPRKIGETTIYYTETHHRTHHEHWEAVSSLGFSKDVQKSTFDNIREKFEDYTQQMPNPSKRGFYSGDPYIYVSKNKTGYIFPITGTETYVNKTKSAPHTFNFIEVSKDTPVFKYPINNWMRSSRLIGTAAKSIDILDFDKLNSRICRVKFANLILIGFGDVDPEICEYQESAWYGGKKNDIVICYGGADALHASWAYCFSWTDNSSLKRELEKIIVRGTLNTNMLAQIEKKIYKDYVAKDWSDFDKVVVEPPRSAFIALLFVILVTQGIFFGICYFNSYDDFYIPTANKRKYMAFKNSRRFNDFRRM